MKINWKVRLKNKVFLVAAASFVTLVISEFGKLFGFDVTVINSTIEHYFEMALYLLVGLGVVQDATTKGISDSYQAMQYEEPKKDEVEIIE